MISEKMSTGPEDILNFWFTDAAHHPIKAQSRKDFWFGSSSEIDEVVRRRFASSVAAAARGELSDWLTQARSALALVIVLDQFPRNIWRGQHEAFTHDTQALRAAHYGVDAGYLAALSPVEGAFLIMPYQHSELLECQRKSVQLFEDLAQSAPAEWRPLLEEYLSFARQHLAIIERFGRFPHRNHVLRRQSTPEEDRYLTSGGATFGQG